MNRAAVPRSASAPPARRPGAKVLPDGRRRFGRTVGAGFALVLWATAAHPAGTDWPVFLGDGASSQFSTLDQINPDNAEQLEVAWIYRSGDGREDNRSQIQCNPLVIDGVLYGTTPRLKLVAVDAATGGEGWRFDPFAEEGGDSSLGVNRGVVFWREGDDRRVLFTAGHHLFAVDASSGRLVAGFGDGGRVDIREGLGRDASSLHVLSNTPGVVWRNLLILGTRVSEGPGPSAPGHIRAYDVRTGKIAWTFRTIPRPGEFGYDTWPPDAWTYVGGANCWTGMAVDEARGLVFCPTGSAAFDFWGGDRIGADLFANCLLALDAATGERRWHFQFVHHDLWDRDLPAPPNLLTVVHEGRRIDAVAQCTKSGHVFVFNRETGEPLFPIEERVVPPSDLQGESAWPTQPLPLKPAPFARQTFGYDTITDRTPAAHRAVLERFVKVRPHAPFMPPSAEGTLIFPGFDGGAEWGGAAVDPRKGILYVNANEMPWILTMVETRVKEGQVPMSSGQQIFNQICAACHGINRQGDPTRTIPSLVGVEARLKKSDVLALLTTGKGVMPSFAFLTDWQKESVIAFLFGEEKPDAAKAANTGGDALGRTPYTHTGYNRFFDPDGYPAVKPPWGTLNAIDLNTGEFVWRVPLGELPELTVQGMPVTGTENYGGPVVTAGGVIFIGATKDEMFRVIEAATGRVCWQTRLPAGGYATPSTYSVNGRQYVVIACGGGKMGTPSGDAYVAFALPERRGDADR
ncbi:MAG: PQQ-binding-like beta-propeller repeat protein [Verrucomicrobiales bacterium]|nr:PQQ-binding-like beta-propeller repeat protein [Verrucomicrobiales bacterium]MCP5527188.1 PQQ-binding-like beta-propeller repeat protein [Verrucomicrobiales bacterium]